MDKRCSRCKQIKNLQDFDIDKRSKSGRMSACKECRSIEFKDNFDTLCSDINYRFSHAISYSKGKKIPFLLTKEEYKALIELPCHYCDGFRKTIGIQLDRIDNDKTIGYIKGNVLPCCYFCNVVRGKHFTVEETRVAVQAVLQFRKSQDNS